MEELEQIGYVVGGGLKEGLRVRLTVPADQIQEGSFVVSDSGRWRYYGLVTDIQLGATDPRFADEPNTRLQPAVRQALLGRTLFTTLNVYSTLMLDRGPEPGEAGYDEYQREALRGEISPRPVKTVPTHHATMRLADENDVAEIFKGNFEIGQTIEQGHPVRIDLEKLVKRSSGIFGATGTGKSFLTRMVLAGLMRDDVAAALVFDMHNEYAYSAQDSDNAVPVQGLRDLFGNKVQVAALGKGAHVGGSIPDFTLEIGFKDFQTTDIEMLGSILNLTDTASTTLSALVREFKGSWFASFIKLEPGLTMLNDKDKPVPAPGSVAFWAREANVNESAAEALHRRLMRIAEKGYVVENPATDAVSAIVDKLENGRHVILSFGGNDSDLDYLLVTNILTRRIRQHWVEKTEKAKIDNLPNPRPLVIAIEEAHKLLNPHMAGQTTFGIIARELRKYFVTLLVIDQRPSGIDDEIMSQLGTRITGWLGDEDDIRAVLSGLAGRDQLRGMLARLQEKEEVLLLGWGVRMPIPVRSRRYDQAFYDDMRGRQRPVEEDTVDDFNDVLGLG